jgi:hypothetical protein
MHLMVAGKATPAQLARDQRVGAGSPGILVV